MRKFLVNAVLFILFFTLFTFVMAFVRTSDEFIIYKTTNTSYDKIAWNLDLINNHSEKINGSVVFFGPSLIQGGISDSTLMAHGVKAVNMGLNHHGNEMSLYFLNRVLPFNPKKVFLHLPKATLQNIHPMTPLVYTPDALLSDGQSVNIAFLNYIFKRLPFVMEYIVWNMGSSKITEPPCKVYGIKNSGFKYSETTYNTIKKNVLKSKPVGSVAIIANKIYQLYYDLRSSSMGNFTYITNFAFNTRSQQDFVLNAFAKCESGKIEISQLFLPIIEDVIVRKDFDSSFYYPRKIIKIESLRNFTMFDKAEYWYDPVHFNRKGAEKFTCELLQQGIVKTECQLQNN